MESLKVQAKIYQVLLRENDFFDADLAQASFTKLNKTVRIPLMSDEWLENKYQLMLKMIKSKNFIRKKTNLCRYCKHSIRCMTPYTLKQVCEIY